MPTRDVISGSITVTLEEFTYQGETRERPIKVVTNNISRHKVSPKPAAPLPISLFHKGKTTHDPMIPIDMDYGHLIALELGGPNTSENIVLMNASVNRRGDWKDVERGMKRKHKLIQSVKITLAYAWSDARVPSTLTANVVCSGKSESKPVSNIMTASPAAVTVLADVRNGLKIAQKEIDKGWTLEQWAKDNGHSVPNLPNQVGPYAALDYLRCVGINKNILLDDATIQNGGGFKKKQREFIMMANAIKNGGTLRSDMLNDPYPGDLSLEGSDTYPEIDHIRSKTVNAGCNAYSNAQIISGKANKAKGGLSQVEEEDDDDDDLDDTDMAMI